MPWQPMSKCTITTHVNLSNERVDAERVDEFDIELTVPCEQLSHLILCM